MANKDNAYGLKPVAFKNGASWSGEVTPYLIPASVSTDIFIGDAVIKAGTSNATEIQGYKPGTLPTLAKAGATGAITGVVTGILPVTDESEIYGVASTDRVAFVCDDPNVVFRAQCNGTLAVTQIGLNADRTVATGDTFTGLSADEVNLASALSTATLQLKILRLSNIEDNEIGADAQVDVIINNHTEANNTVGI